MRASLRRRNFNKRRKSCSDRIRDIAERFDDLSPSPLQRGGGNSGRGATKALPFAEGEGGCPRADEWGWEYVERIANPHHPLRGSLPFEKGRPWIPVPTRHSEPPCGAKNPEDENSDFVLRDVSVAELPQHDAVKPSPRYDKRAPPPLPLPLKYKGEGTEAQQNPPPSQGGGRMAPNLPHRQNFQSIR